MGPVDPIRDQAAHWAVLTSDPAFDDWEKFTAWLESHPDHAATYDRVMAAVAEAAEADIPAPAPAANDGDAGEMPQSPARRRWLGGALAASVAVLAVIGVWQSRDGSQTFETAPGETRVIALADGGEIVLSGGTRLLFDPEDPREAALEAGQALFTITHDPANPFRLEVGGDRLVDIGTVFDVAARPDSLTVAVSEGAVLFNPDGQNVELQPGDMLTSAVGSAEYTLSRVPLEQVGEWRTGRLTFQNATIAELAGDLTRATGIPFAAAEGAANAPRVSGSLLLGPVRDDPRTIAPLLGVTVRRQGDSWIIAVQ
ncbi:transmembrane sensor [Altererythrobacter atlanticus]|uniref:Fec operon regulator FecR n=1 Tax=Croceibacterium atlanticum TaxID=1267766 RepID=A0A0F7KY11_9SPHN|nr:FecR domain-containing protein [Croceibacterium atlanticum]AKH44131.1 fec operon regulator FecR [Croceibacterium atlanticum]MBB5732441.1 transmembrane sensor [Croceibacterium atlanticum]